MTVSAAEISAHLQGIAGAIDHTLEDVAGEKLGFILLVWAGGEVNYVGTDNDRPKVMKAMRELMAKWEAEVDDTPAHHRN